jgi:pyrimidine operon attenuation protein/uracil phosphoribosyltransferase
MTEQHLSPSVPNAEQLYADLRAAVAAALTPQTVLLGIYSGGAWLAQRLAADLQLQGRVGFISSSMYRDDFAKRGLAASLPTDIPFDIDGAPILLIDDVLHTGRTIRAVLNELFDHGRPAQVQLMVLVDRAGRQLPFAANFAAAQADFAPQTSLNLSKNDAGQLAFTLKNKEQAHAE